MNVTNEEIVLQDPHNDDSTDSNPSIFVLMETRKRNSSYEGLHDITHYIYIDSTINVTTEMVVTVIHRNLSLNIIRVDHCNDENFMLLCRKCE